MGYKISPDLTRDDYSILMLAFGFDNVDRFIAFIVDQQRQAWALPEKISYPMKVAELELPEEDNSVFRSGGQIHQYGPRPRIVTARPPMVYGGGRA